jgi:tRNA pseudouridine13 synthase
MTLDPKVRLLLVSAVQSELFNRVLARRITTFDQIQAGDLAWLHRNGACFSVLDPEAEQPRCAAFEISPTGPLFGRRMTAAGGDQGALEEQVLADSGLTIGDLSGRGGVRLSGARRPLRVPIAESAIHAETDRRGRSLWLSFVLPAGSYATEVLREICKPDADGGQTSPTSPSAAP